MVAAPLPWAVMSPPLLIVRTPTLSDSQSLHVAMTFCEVPFAKVPIGVTCAVSPIDLIASALTDNITDCKICELEVGDGVGVDVEGPDGAGDWLSQAAMQIASARIKRTRFMERLLASPCRRRCSSAIARNAVLITNAATPPTWGRQVATLRSCSRHVDLSFDSASHNRNAATSPARFG